jgi:hypothetical protein
MLAAVAVCVGGCGLGAGPTPSAIVLTVTRDFGETTLPRHGPLAVSGQETVMSLLMRNYTVTTRFGGGFVQSIDGLSGGHEGGAAVDWFYFVNGVQASKGAASTDVSPGDHIWWDRHDWSQTEEVPAVVGSFPEPFLNGLEGKRLPVRVECGPSSQEACQLVARRLQAIGVPAALAGIAQAEQPHTLRVMVGTWPEVRSESGAQDIERGPSASGVYARMNATGTKLTLLDAEGHASSTLEAGSGLIAATRHAEEAPVWLVTGTDSAGVKLAAESLQQSSLENHFAVAVVPGRVIALPAGGSG